MRRFVAVVFGLIILALFGFMMYVTYTEVGGIEELVAYENTGFDQLKTLAAFLVRSAMFPLLGFTLIAYGFGREGLARVLAIASIAAIALSLVTMIIVSTT